MSFPQWPSNTETNHPKVNSMASLGHMTAKTCKLWVRLYRGGTWWLVVTEKPLSGDLDRLNGKQVDKFVEDLGITPVYIKAAAIDESTDQTHTYTITGLEADKRYYYAVIADLAESDAVPRRVEIGNQIKRYFDSLPSNLQRISFGFYSCHDPFSNHPHGDGAWPHFYQQLIESRALFAIGGGDQVYVDTNSKKDMYSVWEWLARYKNAIVKEMTVNNKLDTTRLINYFTQIYRNYYRIYWNRADLINTHAQFPQYLIWDDHEIMDGWGSYTTKERTKLLNRLFQDDDEKINKQLIDLMFSAAKRVYQEYQHAHNPAKLMELDAVDNADCQWDYHFKYGKFGFFMLDQRGHHDYERADSDHNALLGSKQMDRFQGWLQAKATKSCAAVFVVSPVPVVHWGPFVMSLDVGSAKDDIRDEWEHESNWEERKVLLDSVLQFSHDNNCSVIFLSGDVHSASIYQIENHAKFERAKVFNATSSAISRKPAPQIVELAMKKQGPLEGYDGGYVKRLYAFAGKYNFFTVDADASSESSSVSVNLCWPGGSDGEVVKKRIKLT